MTLTAIACYRPLPGKSAALDALACSHTARLYVQGLVTRRKPVFMRAADGTLIEIFEWKSQRAVEAAHGNPAVQEMWAQYAEVCTYVPVGKLPEATSLFSSFESLRLPVQPAPLAHLPNQVQVDECIGTSGLLTAEHLEEIAQAGYRVLIDLLPADHPRALPNERVLAGAHGMRYAHIPVDFAAPTEGDLHAFEDAMAGATPDERIWIHCAANYRVTAFMGLYGARHLGWDRARAEALTAEVWTPDAVWRAFIERHLPG